MGHRTAETSVVREEVFVVREEVLVDSGWFRWYRLLRLSNLGGRCGYRALYVNCCIIARRYNIETRRLRRR